MGRLILEEGSAARVDALGGPDLILSAEERQRYRAMDHRQQTDWLSGRLAAKLCLYKLCMPAVVPEHPPFEPETRSVHRALAAFRVLNLPTGEPYAPDFPNCQLSITHTGGRAVALASLLPELRFGVDLQAVVAADDVLVGAVLSAEGQKAVYASADPATVFTRYWCLKESALKALGLGIQPVYRSLGRRVQVISRAGAASHRVVVHTDQGVCLGRGHCFQQNDHVLTVVWVLGTPRR